MWESDCVKKLFKKVQYIVNMGHAKYGDGTVITMLKALPPWAFKALAVAAGLFVVFLVGLLVLKYYRKLTDRLPLD
ncbi:hypothetical protein [Dethiosulfatarculus sandiegensis]|nr:hypothetical protein [Dethiosulfatarculus sandiegensis]